MKTGRDIASRPKRRRRLVPKRDIRSTPARSAATTTEIRYRERSVIITGQRSYLRSVPRAVTRSILAVDAGTNIEAERQKQADIATLKGHIPRLVPRAAIRFMSAVGVGTVTGTTYRNRLGITLKRRKSLRAVPRAGKRSIIVRYAAMKSLSRTEVCQRDMTIRTPSCAKRRVRKRGRGKAYATPAAILLKRRSQRTGITT